MSDLLSNLQKRARTWAAQISRKANSASKPKHIRVSSTSEVGSNRVIINSTAASPKDDARAYEYGSGIHSTSKKRTKWQQADSRILITPKRKKVLAFDWQVAYGPLPVGGKKLIGRSTREIDPRTGGYKILFRYVEHPGVRAANGGKGYLRPAIKEVRKTMNAELKKEMGDAYKVTIRKAFTK